MTPAMYWSASAGLIQAEKMWRKNSQPMSAIEKGLTSQFTNSVTSSPRGFSWTCRRAPKSTFIIIGMIISQMSTAMGTLTWLPLPNSIPRRACTRPGVNLPSARPAIMQSPTQRVRYLSKRFNRFGGAIVGVPCTTVPMSASLADHPQIQPVITPG